MATIPMGNFGNTVAQPQRATSASPDAFGAAQGAALAQVGQDVQQMAIKQMAEQTRQQQAQLDASERSKAIVSDVRVQNELADKASNVADRYKRGELDKIGAMAEWDALSEESISAGVQGVAQDHAGVLQAQFQKYKFNGRNAIEKAITDHDASGVGADLLALGESAERMAMQDRPTAVAKYTAALQALGPAAGLSPEEIQRRVGSFKERTAYNAAAAVVKSAGDNPAAIRGAINALDSGQFMDADPGKLVALRGGLEQRAALAEERAARKEEAHLRKAEAAFKTAQELTDSGLPLSVDEITRLSADTQGTPYAQGLVSLQERAKEVGGFAAQPLANQRAAVQALDQQMAATGASESLMKRRDALQKVQAKTEQAINEDALRAAEQRGLIKLQPVDISSIQGLASTIGARLQSAQVAQVWAGRPVSPLTADEAQRTASMLASLPVQQRATALASIGQALGAQASAGLAGQIDKQDKGLALSLQYGASKTTEGRHTSELILRGQQAIKDKTIKPETVAESGWRAKIAQELGDSYPSPRMADDVREAAYLITAGLAAEGSVDVGRAVRLAAGGRIVEFNGRKIPIPAGMEEGDFSDRINNLAPSAFFDQAQDGKVMAGGQSVPLDAFVKTLPDSQLIYAGPGRYNVLAGSRIVTNTAGKPIIIKARP